MSPSVIETIVLDRKENKDEPLYQQIRRQLSDKINTGEAQPGERFPSLASLAKKWNVSYQTIRTAFELLVDDGLVTYQTNKCILVSDRPGTSTKKSTQRMTVSYVSCHHDDPYYAIMSAGIRKYAIEHDWRYMMLDVGNDREAFIEAVSNPGRECDGLLVLPFEIPGYEQALQQAIDTGVQTVFVDRVLPEVKASSVESDHFSVAYQATTHLLEGHNQPVFYLAFAREPSGARDWFKGWSSAMNVYGYTDLDPYVFDLAVPEAKFADTLDNGFEYSIAAATRLFKTVKQDRYCIYAGNDFIARAVYVVADMMGLEVGRDIFVVGSGDLPLAQRLPVPLTSVRTLPSTEQLGYEAARLLDQHLRGEIKQPMRRLLPVDLVVRTSSIG